MEIVRKSREKNKQRIRLRKAVPSEAVESKIERDRKEWQRREKDSHSYNNRRNSLFNGTSR